jgi:hypothetical protein
LAAGQSGTVAAVDYLSLTDLFLVGLGLDISGAILLAKGLLLSPRELAMLNTYYGSSNGVHKDRCRNRALGEFGVAYLTAGFVLQAVGYALEIGGHPSRTGSDRLFAALVMTAVVLAVAWTAWALLNTRRVDALLAKAEAKHPEVAREINEMTEDKS